MTKILLIEDDPKIRMLLQSDFELEGYEVIATNDGLDGIDRVKQHKPDIIVLDVMLPGMSGYDVCRTLRKEGWATPILMLTARGQEPEKVLGLTLGADDYVVKPVGTLELLARIKALLRRGQTSKAEQDCLSFDDIEIDFRTHTAKKGQISLALTARDFAMLRLFVAKEGEVISRDVFLQQVWGYQAIPSTRAVDNQILSLRKKLSGNSPKNYIETVHGLGYRFTR